MDGPDHGNVERNCEARKTSLRDSNALEMATVCETCKTVLKTYSSVDVDSMAIESTELIEDRAARGCHLCTYFISRLSIESEAAQQRSVYRETRAAATLNTVDVLYKKFRLSSSSLSSSMMIVEITLRDATSIYGRRSHNLWTRFLPARNLKESMRTENPGWSSESKQSFTHARNWYLKCLTHPKICRIAPNYSGSSPLPTRLLSIGEAFPTNLRLCHGCDLPQGTVYTTLSHCWGKRTMMKLLECNYISMMERIVFAELPKTFRDAIIVSKMLGVGDIWIDSLCIIQDSTRDWQREASLMHQVYRNGICNISATAAVDGSEGLFFPRDPATLRHLCFEACIDGTKACFSPCDEGLWEKSVADAPLNGRAWVCQERILAKRNLHFARGQVFWECCELLACETFLSGFSIQWDNMSLKQDISNFFAACFVKRVPGDLALPPDNETVDWAYQIWGKIINKKDFLKKAHCSQMPNLIIAQEVSSPLRNCP